MEIKKEIRYIHKKDKHIVYYEVWNEGKLLGTFQTSKLAKAFINEFFGVKHDGRTKGEVEGSTEEVSEV